MISQNTMAGYDDMITGTAKACIAYSSDVEYSEISDESVNDRIFDIVQDGGGRLQSLMNVNNYHDLGGAASLCESVTNNSLDCAMSNLRTIDYNDPSSIMMQGMLYDLVSLTGIDKQLSKITAP
jgi:hypothetical protein